MNLMKGGTIFKMYIQRDIVLIPFPYSDLTGSKQRPALIISNSKLNNTEDRICCLVTSKIHRDDIIIENEDFETGKLPFKSSVKCHRIFTINEKIIKKKLCRVNEKLYKKVLDEIGTYLR